MESMKVFAYSTIGKFCIKRSRPGFDLSHTVTCGILSRLATPAGVSYITAYTGLSSSRTVDTHILHQQYLADGTAGYAVIRRFYAKYADVLARTNLIDLNDILHEVFVSLSKTDFSQIQNHEHYLMRAIKLHCWTLLDKAIRAKALTADPRVELHGEEDAAEPETRELSSPDHLATIEGVELLAYVNMFKAGLTPRDSRLLNLLIDETERSEIARSLELNMNTLDTSIRRLRIRLAEFLRNLGYTYKSLERFV